MNQVPKGYTPVNRQDITFSGRPVAMPALDDGQLLVCEYIRAQGIPSLNLNMICTSVADMQKLYDGYAGGGAVQLKWYICDELVMVQTLEEWKREEEAKKV